MNEPNDRLKALGDRREVVRISLADRAYSAIVKKLRWVLPAAALGIVTALMIWPEIQTELSRGRFDTPKMDAEALKKAAAENRLMNATFTSTDSKGRPFSIVADEARADNAKPDDIILNRPRGTLNLDSGVSMEGRADRGLYHQTAQKLDLSGAVEVRRSDGTVMRSEKLLVDLMSNDARTQTPLTIEGPDGTIAAQGLDTAGGGATIVFAGPVKMVIVPKNSINPRGSAR